MTPHAVIDPPSVETIVRPRTAKAQAVASARRAGALLAIALALVLTIGRTVADWEHLSVLRLPDNDDMMRLAQVRDWLAGQGFHDLMQHRLGMPPDGASMHWSRIADAGPAALLLIFRPVLGTTAGALAMVIVYQAMLLAAYLLLAGRNARLLIGERAMVPAVVFAALAFPTITLFVPGRIDHHALQIVLTMVAVGGFLSPPSWRAGIAAGVAIALSLAIGLEVAPELVVLIGIVGVQWLLGGTRETPRLAGLAMALGATTLGLLWLTRPLVWPQQWCDGFTPASTAATIGASIALALLALVGVRWSARLPRALGATLAAAASAAWAWHSARVCLNGPYGAMTPFLKHAFMDNVGEARELFFSQNTWGTCLAFGGPAFAAVVVLALLMRDPDVRRTWWAIATFIMLSTVVFVLQIRVSYILAGIATLPFVALMVRARAGHWGLGRRLAIWLAGAGIAWNIVGIFLDNAVTPAPMLAARETQKDCLAGGPLVALARLPAGNVMAPLDSGAYVIGMTPHRSFAAPYHRNNAGNMAMYRFFLSPPATAAAMAQRLGVTYVVACDDSLQEAAVLPLRHDSLIQALQAGHAPTWLAPIFRQPTGMMIYRVR